MSEENVLLSKINEDFQRVTESRNSESYLRLSGTLEKIESELSGYALKLAIDEMKAVSKKLKEYEDLSDEDMTKLKLWIIGDAEYYIKKEHNIEGWDSNLKRLIKQTNESWADHPDAERLLKLKSLAREALSAVADVAYYIKQKESVEKFNAAIKEIGESERVVLVSLLEQKISASRF
jgi:hypothetical protein